MFEETKLFGVSMAPRANRRALVIITYVVTAGALAGCVVLSRFTGTTYGNPVLRLLPLLLVWLPFSVVYLVIPGGGNVRGIFGRFVPEQTFRRRAQAPRTLGLGRGLLDDQPAIDERETLVRNSAYFKAFRIVAWYAYFYVFLCIYPLARGAGSLARTVAAIGATPIVVMLFTLPQAIVLWTEPDLPQEGSQETLG